MHQKKLSRVLDLIINEETEAAAALLHDFLVEKSRVIYEEVMCDDEESDEDKEEVCEEFGDESEKEGFAADVEADNDEIDADEQDDLSDVDAESDADEGEEEDEGEFGEEEGEEDLEDKVDSLTAQLDALQAAFDELLSQEAEEPNHDFSDIGDEFGDEDEFGGEEVGGDEFAGKFGDEEFEESYIGEATKFSDDVATPEMKDKAANKASPYTKAPSKQDFGGKPTQFAKGAGEGKKADKTAKKEKVEDNIDVPSKNQSADLKGEGKYSAKGGSSGAVQGKSPLSKKPK